MHTLKVTLLLRSKHTGELAHMDAEMLYLECYLPSVMPTSTGASQGRSPSKTRTQHSPVAGWTPTRAEYAEGSNIFSDGAEDGRGAMSLLGAADMDCVVPSMHRAAAASAPSVAELLGT